MDEEWMAMEESCKKKISVGFTNDPMPMEFLFVIRDKSERVQIDQTTSLFWTLHILSSLNPQVC